jgi:hypothetical protein
MTTPDEITGSSINAGTEIAASTMTEESSAENSSTYECTYDFERSPTTLSGVSHEIDEHGYENDINEFNEADVAKDLDDVKGRVLGSPFSSPKSLAETKYTKSDSHQDLSCDEAIDSAKDADGDINTDQNDDIKKIPIVNMSSNAEPLGNEPLPSPAPEDETKEVAIMTNNVIVDKTQPRATDEATGLSKSVHSVPPHMRLDFSLSATRCSESPSSRVRFRFSFQALP